MKIPRNSTRSWQMLASEGVPPSRTSDQESPEEEKVVVARRNDQQVSGDTPHARERGRNYSPIPQGRAFLSGAAFPFPGRHFSNTTREEARV